MTTGPFSVSEFATITGRAFHVCMHEHEFDIDDFTTRAAAEEQADLLNRAYAAGLRDGAQGDRSLSIHADAMRAFVGERIDDLAQAMTEIAAKCWHCQGSARYRLRTLGLVEVTIETQGERRVVMGIERVEL